MEDFGEYTPLDSRSANGMTGAQMHNLYPVQLPLRRLRVRARRSRGRSRASSARAGPASRRCAQIVWGGDPTTELGLRRPRVGGHATALTMGLSGIIAWGSDIGGFFALGDRPAHAGAAQALDPVRRRVGGHAHPGQRLRAVPRKPRPQIWRPRRARRSGAATRSCARSSTPTSRRPTREYRRTGLPLMRHLALAYPRRPGARSRATTSSCSAPTCWPRR